MQRLVIEIMSFGHKVDCEFKDGRADKFFGGKCPCGYRNPDLCFKCNGTGYLSSWSTCQSCFGVGRYRLEMEDVYCTDCDGTARFEQTVIAIVATATGCVWESAENDKVAIM